LSGNPAGASVPGPWPAAPCTRRRSSRICARGS
jgi:hypothetical protein